MSNTNSHTLLFSGFDLLQLTLFLFLVHLLHCSTTDADKRTKGGRVADKRVGESIVAAGGASSTKHSDAVITIVGKVEDAL